MDIMKEHKQMSMNSPAFNGYIAALSYMMKDQVGSDLIFAKVVVSDNCLLMW